MMDAVGNERTALLRRAVPALRIAVTAGLLVYLTRTGALDWRAMEGLLGEWSTVASAMAVIAAATAVAAMRLPVLLRTLGYRLSFLSSLSVVAVGVFFGMILPSVGGGAARAYFVVADRKAGTRIELVTLTLLEQAIAMWALFATPLAAALFFFDRETASPVLVAMLQASAGIFLAGLIALVLALSVQTRMIDWALGTGSGRIRRSIDALRSYRNRPGALLATLGLAMCNHLLTTFAAYLLAGVVAPSCQRPEFMLVFPLAFVANVLAITPGGIGVGEIASERLFTALGMEGGAHVVLAWRFLIACIGAVGGLLVARGVRVEVGVES